MALSGWQERAVGRVEPNLEDDVLRRSLSCAGTVIAPNWVLTASHCHLPASEPLQFVVVSGEGETLGSWSSLRVVEHPERDAMLVELDARWEAVAELLTPIPAAAADIHVQPGDILQLVTFSMHDTANAGRRRFLAEPVTQVTADELMVDGHGRSGACGGDSGGPLLGRGSDGTVRVYGSLVEGSADCLGFDVYARVYDSDSFVADHVPGGCDVGACGELDETGRCLGGRAVWCSGGQVLTQACGSSEACGWDVEAAGYRCLPQGEGPCPGVDHFGVCVGDVVQWCDRGELSSADCRVQGLVCVRDPDGHAGCG